MLNLRAVRFENCFLKREHGKEQVTVTEKEGGAGAGREGRPLSEQVSTGLDEVSMGAIWLDRQTDRTEKIPFRNFVGRR